MVLTTRLRAVTTWNVTYTVRVSNTARGAEEIENKPPTKLNIGKKYLDFSIEEGYRASRNNKMEKMIKKTAKLQSYDGSIPDEEEVAVDAIPLATKPQSIVDWKIIKEGNIGYYQIIRADGTSKSDARKDLETGEERHILQS
ncbi:hypothetical protein Tco_0851089 [Tanacetum coccineum]